MVPRCGAEGGLDERAERDNASNVSVSVEADGKVGRKSRCRAVDRVGVMGYC